MKEKFRKMYGGMKVIMKKADGKKKNDSALVFSSMSGL
jgi:hypothetical protein